MFEHLHIFTSQFWGFLGLALLAMAAGAYYLSLTLTGLHLRKIGQVYSNTRISTCYMSFFQALVCFMVVAKFLFPLYSDIKVLISLLLFTFASIARFLYWRNLSYYFKESGISRIIYTVFASCAIFMALFHIILFFIEGGGTCCLAPDVINHTKSDIIRVQNPFKFSPMLRVFQGLYIIIVLIFYIRFFIKSLRTDDFIMKLGIGISTVYLSYSISYFVFGYHYWIPLFYLMDILEYTRLQKIEIEQINKDFEGQEEQEAMLVNDMIKPLNMAWGRLRAIKNKSGNNEDVNSLYKTTASAIDILKKYQNEDQQNLQISIVIKEVIDIFHEIDIEYIPPKNEVQINELIIKNVLINLIKNSSEALGGNLKWIKIAAFNIENNRLHLRYTDSGLFENFIDPHNAFSYGVSSKVGESRGIGLASIKADIESIGGQIELGAYKGNTCFDLFL